MPAVKSFPDKHLWSKGGSAQRRRAVPHASCFFPSISIWNLSRLQFKLELQCDEASGQEPFARLSGHVPNCKSDCWKMCASATMASLKFPLQDPLQQAASINTATISDELIFCTTNRSLIQHLLEIVPSECTMLGDQEEHQCEIDQRVRRSNRLGAD